MNNPNQETIDALIKEFDNCINGVENNNTEREHYVGLYNAILKSLPHLSNRKVSWFPSHEVIGDLEHKYHINYSSSLGYGHMAVTDISHAETHPKLRTYIVRAVFGIQLPIDTISLIDTRTGSMTTIHQNQPF